MRIKLKNGIQLKGSCYSALCFILWKPLKSMKILWYCGPARWEMRSIRTETTVSTLRQCWDSSSEKRIWTIGSFDKFQLVLLRWLLATLTVLVVTEPSKYEGQVPVKPYNCCFSTVFHLYCHIWHVRAIPTYRVYWHCDSWRLTSVLLKLTTNSIMHNWVM